MEVLNITKLADKVERWQGFQLPTELQKSHSAKSSWSNFLICFTIHCTFCRAKARGNQGKHYPEPNTEPECEVTNNLEEGNLSF